MKRLSGEIQIANYSYAIILSIGIVLYFVFTMVFTITSFGSYGMTCLPSLFRVPYFRSNSFSLTHFSFTKDSLLMFLMTGMNIYRSRCNNNVLCTFTSYLCMVFVFELNVSTSIAFMNVPLLQT